jgi:hypothetical protein
MVGTSRKCGAVDQHDFVTAALGLVDSELKVLITCEKHLGYLISSAYIRIFLKRNRNFTHRISKGSFEF